MERDALDRLLRQAFLYDDPRAYRAGVEAAWRELSRVRAVEERAPGIDPTPAGAGPTRTAAAG